MISIAINGAAGRMGCRLVALCTEDDQLQLRAAIERSGHPLLGKDAGAIAGTSPLGLALSDALTDKIGVLIDFTSPAAMRSALKVCLDAGSAMVIGTTGLGTDDHRAIDEAAKTIPVLQAPNMSLGVNLLFA